MTTTEIETAARNKYNSTGDTFYTTAEIKDYIYQAELELAQVCPIIESTHTDTSVASQQEYSFPTATNVIKRITYDGKKLAPFTFRDDDTVTGLTSNTTTTGTPEYYATWGRTIYLRPIPATSSKTIKIFSEDLPAVISGTSLDVPSLFHMDIVDFVVAQMAYKDENSRVGQMYEARWERAKQKAIAWTKKRKRGDAFGSVQCEEQHAATQFGTT